MKHEVMTASQLFTVKTQAKGDVKAWVQFLVSMRYTGQSIDWTPSGQPLQAWINRGVWCVSCPDCPEVMPAEPSIPFFCPNCLNKGNGYAARGVIFPQERAEIERILNMRFDKETQNWLLTETVADLIAQNKERGEWRE